MSVRYIERIGEAYNVSSASTLAFTCSAAVPVGRLVIFAGRGVAGANITSVSDSSSNTWTLINRTTTQATCSVYYSVVTTALTTSSTVTATYSSSQAQYNIAAWSFDGLTRPSITSSTASGSGVTTVNTGNFSNPQYGSLIFSAVTNSNAPTFTAPSGFTALPLSTSTVFLQGAYAIRSSMDAIATTWTASVSGNMGLVTTTLTQDGGDFFSMFGNTAAT